MKESSDFVEQAEQPIPQQFVSPTVGARAWRSLFCGLGLLVVATVAGFALVGSSIGPGKGVSSDTSAPESTSAMDLQNATPSLVELGHPNVYNGIPAWPDVLALENDLDITSVYHRDGVGPDGDCEAPKTEIWIRKGQAAWKKSTSPFGISYCEGGTWLLGAAQLDETVVVFALYSLFNPNSFSGFAISRKGEEFYWIDASATAEINFQGVCFPRFEGDPLVAFSGEHALLVGQTRSELHPNTKSWDDKPDSCFDIGGVRRLSGSLMIDAQGRVMSVESDVCRIAEL